MKHFHAHLYYNSDTFELAKRVISQATKLDYVEIGRMHEKPVGPHPMWSCQLLFKTENLSKMIPWLMQNREGLIVFVHPVSGNDLEDHTIHAMWLGEAVDLNIEMFKKS